MPTYSQFESMSTQQLEAAVDTLLSNKIHEICDSSEFCDCSAGTNANGWMADDYECDDEPDFDDSSREVRFPVSYHASGDQIEDMGFCGTEIVGNAMAVIDEVGNLTFEDITAEVKQDN